MIEKPTHSQADSTMPNSNANRSEIDPVTQGSYRFHSYLYPDQNNFNSETNQENWNEQSIINRGTFYSNQSQMASNHATDGSENRMASDSTQTRAPFKSDKSSKFSDSLFFSFKKFQSKNESVKKTPAKIYCGLFEKDDGDFDDNMSTFFEPHHTLEKIFFKSKILVLTYVFILLSLVILFMFFYKIISNLEMYSVFEFLIII